MRINTALLYITVYKNVMKNISDIGQSSTDYSCFVILDRVKIFKTRSNTQWNVTLLTVKRGSFPIEMNRWEP